MDPDVGAGRGRDETDEGRIRAEDAGNTRETRRDKSNSERSEEDRERDGERRGADVI